MRSSTRRVRRGGSADIVLDNVTPKPFYVDGWPRKKRPHALALWRFHEALLDAHAPALDGDDLTAYFEAERANVMRAGKLSVVGPDVAAAAYAACSEYEIPLELLGSQVGASRRLKESVRFADGREASGFIFDWACSHGRALAHLAGASGSWQLRYVDELSTAFFWVGRLMYLPRELDRDWLFIPLSDLEHANVGVEQLKNGNVDENVRRLLWKQTIRAKDAFAQGEPLAIDLRRPYRAAMKRWWLGGLEILNEIARRDYDVWSKPITLSFYYQMLVRFQARFGKTTFRAR